MDITKEETVDAVEWLMSYHMWKSKIKKHEIDMRGMYPSGTAKYGDNVGGSSGCSRPTESCVLQRAAKQERIDELQRRVDLIDCAYSALPRHLKDVCKHYYFDGNFKQVSMRELFLSNRTFIRYKNNIIDKCQPFFV